MTNEQERIINNLIERELHWPIQDAKKVHKQIADALIAMRKELKEIKIIHAYDGEKS